LGFRNGRGKGLAFLVTELALEDFTVQESPPVIGSNGSLRVAHNVNVITVSQNEKVRKLFGKLFKDALNGETIQE